MGDIITSWQRNTMLFAACAQAVFEVEFWLTDSGYPGLFFVTCLELYFDVSERKRDKSASCGFAMRSDPERVCARRMKAPRPSGFTRKIARDVFLPGFSLYAPYRIRKMKEKKFQLVIIPGF